MMSINRATRFIKNLLYIDLKTGLYNERQFEHVLAKAISDQNKLIVLAIDLSNLQELNHHFGYRTIHKLYIEELARIQSLMIPFGSTYKLDGPVLAYIIHSDQNALIDSKTTLLEIINQLESTKFYENQEIHFKYQLLATQYPQDGTYPSQLIDNLYHLKYSNSPSVNSIRWYDQRSFDQLKRRIRLEKDLEQAIQSGDIYIVIQPQVTLKDYKVHGAEGVETKMQCDVLAVFDCDVIQGYWFAKPMLPDQFITFFKNANDL